MTIDEAIAHAREVVENNRKTAEECLLFDRFQKADECVMCAEEHKQLAEWLEELKAIKSDGFTDDLLNMGFTKGYNKALDDFVKFANDMPTVETEDGTIRPMWLEEMAEKLKEQNNGK